MLPGCGTTSTQTLVGPSGPSTPNTADISQGPQVGYVWNQVQGNLYPVLGVAGAARFGAPLLSAKYVTGAVGGGGSGAWALLLDSTGTLDLVTVSASGALGSPVVVGTKVPVDSSIAFAPQGGYAVIVSRATNTALLVSGLPGQPLPAPLSAPGGALVGAAVSDRGTVLAGWTGASGVQVGTLAAAGATAVVSVSAWGGAGFVPGTSAAGPAAGQEQAVVADGGTGQLARLSGIGGAAATVTTLNAGGKLQTPVAVAVSGDGGWAFAADGAKQQVVRVDLVGTTAPVSLACACQPARLVGLPGNLFFEVSTDQAGQPAWLLDGHAAAPRTFFVPALAGTTPAAAVAPTTAKAARGAR